MAPKTKQSTGDEWVTSTAGRLEQTRQAYATAGRGQPLEMSGTAVAGLERVLAARRGETTASSSSVAGGGGSSGSGEPVALGPEDANHRVRELRAQADSVELRGALQGPRKNKYQSPSSRRVLKVMIFQ